MIARLIGWSARNLVLVLVGTVFAVAAGVLALRTLPLDAIPDLSDVQAIVYTEYPGVRPKMMTVVAIMAGLLPILWSTGSGSEVMQRIAVPMIGGMVSSTVLTLVVIPAVYALVKGRGLPRPRRSGTA